MSVDPLSLSRSLAAQLHLGYPIVEDRSHALGSAFGVFRLPASMDMGPVDRHAMFVLDAGGNVRWGQLSPDAMNIPIPDVLAALRRL